MFRFLYFVFLPVCVQSFTLALISQTQAHFFRNWTLLKSFVFIYKWVTWWVSFSIADLLKSYLVNLGVFHAHCFLYLYEQVLFIFRQRFLCFVFCFWCSLVSFLECGGVLFGFFGGGFSVSRTLLTRKEFLKKFKKNWTETIRVVQKLWKLH